MLKNDAESRTMQLIEHADLTACNTMRLPSIARYLARPTTLDELQQVLHSELAAQYPLLVLGGGSNLLLAERLPMLVIQPALMGIRVTQAERDQVWVAAMAGENWHDFVQYCLAHGYYGLENLSLIPGTVGACPIQNIGAYGVEVADRLAWVEAIDLHTQVLRRFSVEECQFAYRDSLFKQQAGRWLITQVCFALSTQPNLVLQYGDVKTLAGDAPTPQSVAAAVIQIRQSKLPDPAQIPNTGSFFKNPVISATQFQQLQQQYPQIAGYPQPDGQVKLAAGWLIDQAGWRGRRLGKVGMYQQQALVLVNPDGGTLSDVLALSAAVVADVERQFAVTLWPEPVMVGAGSDELAAELAAGSNGAAV